MRSALFCIILFGLGFGTASAEFYRYTDRHGNVLYTDDLNKVPADQRTRARSYDEAPAAAVEPKSEQKSEAPQDPAASLENERKRLEEEEKALDHEYDQLLKAREELDKELPKAVAPEQIKAYNQKTTGLNARIQAYEKRLAGYTQKVKAFNNRLKNTPDPARK